MSAPSADRPPHSKLFRAGTLLHMKSSSHRSYGIVSSPYWVEKLGTWCYRIFWSISGMRDGYQHSELEVDIQLGVFRVEVF